MAVSINPAAPEHLPRFMVAPGDTDTFMVLMGVILVVAVMAIGLLFLRIHTLPERIAHKGNKLQFEIVAVLGLLALFTNIHLFWVIGLLLALIEIPDFGGAFGRMAGALEKIARIPAENNADNVQHAADPSTVSMGSEATLNKTVAPPTPTKSETRGEA